MIITGNRRESRSGSDRCANCGMEEDESELRPTTGYVDGIKVITVPGTDSSKPRQYKIPPWYVISSMTITITSLILILLVSISTSCQ